MINNNFPIIGMSRIENKYIISIGSKMYNKQLDVEEGKELSAFILEYNKTPNNDLLNTIKELLSPYSKLTSSDDFTIIEGNLYLTDVYERWQKGEQEYINNLPLKGLLQEKIIEAYESKDMSFYTSLINFHKRCCLNKHAVNIDKLYDHVHNNHFTITLDGYLVVKKKATIETKKDFTKFKGYYLSRGKVHSIFGEVSEQEEKDFLDSFDLSKVYASHINDDTFWLTDKDTGERIEHKGRCEYKLNHITEISQKKIDTDNINCGYKLHSTCDKSYASSFYGNVILTCLLSPEWVVNVPDSEISWKIGSYALWTIGVDNMEDEPTYLNNYFDKEDSNEQDNEEDDEYEGGFCCEDDDDDDDYWEGFPEDLEEDDEDDDDDYDGQEYWR